MKLSMVVGRKGEENLRELKIGSHGNTNVFVTVGKKASVLILPV